MLRRLLAIGLSAGHLCVAAAGAQAVAADVQVRLGNEGVGEMIYAGECRVCHAGLIAPSLRGVIGRPVASVTTFGGYSAALTSLKDQMWSEASIDAFLTSPGAYAPGTAMTKSFPDPQARADIIAFLRTMAPPR